MAYNTPPLTIATQPLINGAINPAIAAPGAGFALRIAGASWSVIVAATGAPAAAGMYRIILRDGIAAVQVSDWVGESGAGGSPSGDKQIPEPGIQLTANQPLNMVGISVVVGQAASLIVYYYIDTVT